MRRSKLKNQSLVALSTAMAAALCLAPVGQVSEEHLRRTLPSFGINSRFRNILAFFSLCFLSFEAAAFTFPTIVEPYKSWRSTPTLGCLNNAIYISPWPGDRPEDVHTQIISAMNEKCKDITVGNITTYTDRGDLPQVKNGGWYGFDTSMWIIAHHVPNNHQYKPWDEPIQVGIAYEKICTNGQYSNKQKFYLTNSASYGECMCPPDRVYVPSVDLCVPRRDRYWEGNMCPRADFGNPINALKGYKRQSVEIGGPAVLGARLSYDTRRKVPFEDPLAVYPMSAPPSFGPLWNSSLHKTLVLQTPVSAAVQAGRGGGDWISFVKEQATGRYLPVTGVDDKLSPSGSSWIFSDSIGLTQETYNSSGVISKVYPARGGIFDHTYTANSEPPYVAGLLKNVVDQFGHQLQFNYEQPADSNLPVRIKEMIDSTGGITQFGYDVAGNLNKITWPDLNVKTFLYEDTNLPWALTGIIDEKSARHSTYGYDTEGRAISTEYAGETNKFSTSWTTPPGWVIEDTYDALNQVVWRDHRWSVPQGTQVTLPARGSTALTATDILGMPRISIQTQPGGSGCGSSGSNLTYDTRGDVTSRLEFGEEGMVDRHRTCYAYDSSRNLETYRLEGMLESNSCPVDLASYQVPNDLPVDKLQRKVTTAWHPLWKLEVRRAEPKRITTTVYNDQPDPIAGGTASCAAGAPLLPDGSSKIAVVCKRYEQSTADETGSLGFAAPVTETRISNYTYNQYGQVMTETDPRGKVTTYDYWPAPTTFTGDGNAARGHWLGDLKTVTNALNQSTNYLEYNKRGQVLSTLLPNGSTEQREYHVRGWLTKVTLVPAGSGVGQVTQYDYYDTGLLKKVTQPDGSFANYTWDDAHRLRDVVDSVNNKVHYELDNAGNRTAEQFQDPAGHLAKTISRTFDALGRMSSVSGLQ